jgi:hypothetical protein
MNTYKFKVCYPDSNVEVYASNKKTAIILAQAQRIKKGLQYDNYFRVETDFNGVWKVI